MRAPGSNSSPSVTLQDVARAAGVSLGTVSRAFRQQGGLTEQTRQQVLQVARDLGYDTDRLRTARLRHVTFLLHRQHTAPDGNPFYSHVLHGVEDECRARGLTLHYSSLSGKDQVGEIVQHHQADGLLGVGYFEGTLMAQLRALNLPLVLVDHFAAALPSVNSDNFGGAYRATRHLLAAGRRRVAYLGGPDHYSIRQRWLGYRQALYDAGIPADPALDVRRDPLDEEDGARAAMLALLALPKPPDAVFAFNDTSALTALRICQDAGLRVPQDIALVGFDGIGAAALSHPALSTVQVDKEALGRQGVGLLLDARRRAENHQETLPTELIVRASSAS